MLGLRCKNGVNVSSLIQKGYDIKENSYIEDYLKQGVLKLENESLYLNPIFYHISNTIISNLIGGVTLIPLIVLIVDVGVIEQKYSLKL